MAKKYTLEDVKKMDTATITPEIVGNVMGCASHAIRLAARSCPGDLHFPVCVLGSRVKIPRLPFIQFMEVNPYAQQEA